MVSLGSWLFGLGVVAIGAVAVGAYASYLLGKIKDKESFRSKWRLYLLWGLFFSLLFLFFRLPFFGKVENFESPQALRAFTLDFGLAFIYGCIVRRLYVLASYGYRGKKVSKWFVLTCVAFMTYFYRGVFFLA